MDMRQRNLWDDGWMVDQRRTPFNDVYDVDVLFGQREAGKQMLHLL